MDKQSCVLNFVLFRNLMDNQIIMMHFDKCIIENDRVKCTCNGKVFNGVLLTVGKSEILCHDNKVINL